MKKAFLIAFALALPVTSLVAQRKDTTHLLGELSVSALRDTLVRMSSLHIISIKGTEMTEKGAFHISDGLSKIPGISQLTTGFAISKPVIRGLYGNRILVLLSGTRFDNQQFQDEHGLGLATIGIQRAEIIKGPASILYGSDAMGGVINLIEEQVDRKIPRQWDAGTRFFSNTLGTITDVGFKRNTGSKWFRFRGGIESHADYADGHGNRVLNSRSNGYYLKLGWGAHGVKKEVENNYNLSVNNFGFITQDLNTIFQADPRWTRSMTGPHHIVVLNTFNTRQKLFLAHSILQINTGLQSNLRMEDEAGGSISLNMHLLSALGSARWEKSLNASNQLIVNGQLTLESNKNYGSRIIIPDAGMLELNLAGFLRHTDKKWLLEGGAGIGSKTIKAYPTSDLNSPDKNVHPFTITRPAVNLLAGFSLFPSDYLTLKANLGTGYRAPNLAELSSDGLHEGTSHYEIGNPSLKIEHNINSDVTAEWTSPFLALSVSTFINRINDYIYLAPTSANYFGFPIYRYFQADALLLGGEGSLHLLPFGSPLIQWKNSVAITRGQLVRQGNLPFIPPPKFNSSIRFEKDVKTGNHLFLEPEWTMVSAQHLTASSETITPSYHLVNMYMGIKHTVKYGQLSISLSIQNAMNTAYFDHLSRLKYYGILNPGRTFVFQTRIPIQ